MFGRSNVFGMIVGFGVRVKDAREKDKNHLIEAKFEVPLDHDLAQEIMPAMAADLFNKVKGGWQAKPEVDELAFNMSPDLQILELREHPELPAVVRIQGVSIRKVVAYKGEADALFLGFTTTWTLGDEQEPIAIIKRLKTGVYMTSTAQQPQLETQPDLVDESQEEEQPGLPTTGDDAGEVDVDQQAQPDLSDEEPDEATDDEDAEDVFVPSEVLTADTADQEHPGDDVGNVEGAAGDVPPRNRRNRRGLRAVAGSVTVN